MNNKMESIWKKVVCGLDGKQTFKRMKEVNEELCVANAGLSRKITSLELKVKQLEADVSSLKIKRKSEDDEIKQSRISLSQLTSERSKWIKKLRRAGVNV